MSDKKFKDLNPLDQQLRRAYPSGMRSGTDVVIRKITGFELFNTRPYHNYETWSDGYEACDGRAYVAAEDLDDCVRKIAALAGMTVSELEPWQRATPSMLVSFGFSGE